MHVLIGFFLYIIVIAIDQFKVFNLIAALF